MMSPNGFDLLKWPHLHLKTDVLGDGADPILFSDTKARKYVFQYIVGAYFTGNFA